MLAVDCEMVGVDRHSDGLARVSIVNYNGHIVYDKYVIPTGRVTDFRTWVSGVKPHMLKAENGAIPFEKAKEEVHKMFKDKLIVGHSLQHDFKSLQYYGDSEKHRDVGKYAKYKN